MQIQELPLLSRFDSKRHVHVPVFLGQRTKVLLLCLASGQEVLPHRHPGFEITLQPLRGKAELPLPDGTKALLTPGMFIAVEDGDFPFNPSNPFEENFEMLIHLIKTDNKQTTNTQ